jgi:catechol 2,3-dioxygenase-like lactoylglutathione lyase family enzyme
VTTSPSLGIDLMQLVTIPTTDQSRSLAFYQSLGFEVRANFPWATDSDGSRSIPPHIDGADSGTGGSGCGWAPHGNYPRHQGDRCRLGTHEATRDRRPCPHRPDSVTCQGPYRRC